MGANIKRLREARRLTLDEVASKIGVTVIELKRMERRWDDPSPTIAKDLAVLLNCNVHELTGVKPEVAEWADWPYSILENEGEEFGGVYIQIAGKTLEYAIDDGSRGRIARQMERLGPLQDSVEKPWIVVSTLCGRLLFINPKAVRSLSLKHDDDTATPYYAHREVYRAMLEYDSDGERGPVLDAAVEEAIAA